MTTAANVIRDTRNATKEVVRFLGCTISQADRCVKRGRAPGEMRAGWLRFLKALRERNLERLRALDEEIRRIEYEEMVSRAAARRSQTMGDDP